MSLVKLLFDRFGRFLAARLLGVARLDSLQCFLVSDYKGFRLGEVIPDVSLNSGLPAVVPFLASLSELKVWVSSSWDDKVSLDLLFFLGNEQGDDEALELTAHISFELRFRFLAILLPKS